MTFGFMSRVAMRLTDQEIKAVAEYISGLPFVHEFEPGLEPGVPHPAAPLF